MTTPIEPSICARILESLQSAVIVVDPEGLVRHANPAAARLLLQDKLEGRPVGSVLRVFDENSCARIEEYGSLAAVGGVKETLLLVRPDGTERHVGIQVLTFASGPSREEVLVLSDVTDLCETRRRVRYIASHDLVTGTLTRTELMQRLSTISRQFPDDSLRRVLYYVSIAGLDNVLSAYGVVALDSLLGQLGHCLNSHVNRADAVGRLGDSEFGIVMVAGSDGGPYSEYLLGVLSRFRFDWDGAAHYVVAHIAELPIASGVDVNVLLMAGKDACKRLHEHGRSLVSVTLAELESRARSER